MKRDTGHNRTEEKANTLLVVLMVILIIAFSFLSVRAAPFNVGIGGLNLNIDVKSLREIKTDGIVIQKHDYSCGSAAMATLMSYLGEEVDEEEVIESILRTGNLKKIAKRGGFSLLDLKRYAESRGYNAEGYRADTLSDLLRFSLGSGESMLPVLVPIVINNYKHFVILKGIRDGRVFIADPSRGNTTMPVYEFEKYWFKNIFLIVKREGIELEEMLEEKNASFVENYNPSTLKSLSVPFISRDPGRF